MGDQFSKKIKDLTILHFQRCTEYRKILNTINYDIKNEDLALQPFLPVNLFKSKKMISVPDNQVVKVLQSSGTTGSVRSKIYLDQDNAVNQKKVLIDLAKNIMPQNRIPMLIIDQNPNNVDRKNLEARLAGIFGFSIFGKNYTYLLDKKGNIDYKNLDNFYKDYSKQEFFIFGFTSMVYEYLIKKLKSDYDFKNGLLIHGGGWKKIESEKINNKKFRDLLYKKVNLKKVYNYYGLVEQTGSIFFECEKCNSFYSTKYSKVFIRNEKFEILKKGKGMIQIISSVPVSYPGHNILTEDIGELILNNCSCKKYGNRFKVYGRIEKSKIRGCSNI